jgi:hypothetical protein
MGVTCTNLVLVRTWKKKSTMIEGEGGGSKEGGGAFIFNTNYRRIEN